MNEGLRHLNKPRMIDFPVHSDPTGWLAVADECDLPFEVKRVFYMWNLYKDRGHHALKTCHQLLFVPSGGMTVRTTQGITHMDVTTFNFNNRRESGLCLPPLTWRWLEDFELGTTCFVLCSHSYDPDDYIHDFDEFAEYLMDNKLQEGIKFSDES